MIPKLTDDQREALRNHDGLIPVEDDQSHQVYLLMDQATLETLRRDADCEAIRHGITDVESRRVLTLDELDGRIQANLRRLKSA